MLCYPDLTSWMQASAKPLSSPRSPLFARPASSSRSSRNSPVQHRRLSDAGSAHPSLLDARARADALAERAATAEAAAARAVDELQVASCAACHAREEADYLRSDVAVARGEVAVAMDNAQAAKAEAAMLRAELVAMREGRRNFVQMTEVPDVGGSGMLNRCEAHAYGSSSERLPDALRLSGPNQAAGEVGSGPCLDLSSGIVCCSHDKYVTRGRPTERQQSIATRLDAAKDVSLQLGSREPELQEVQQEDQEGLKAELAAALVRCGELQNVKEQLHKARQALETLQIERDIGKSMHENSRDELAEVKSDLAATRLETDAARRRAERFQRESEDAAASIRCLEQASTALRMELKDAELQQQGQLTRLQAELDTERAERAAFEKRVGRLDDELAAAQRVQGNVANLQEELETARVKLAAERRMSGQTGQLLHLQKELDSLRAELATSKTSADRAARLEEELEEAHVQLAAARRVPGQTRQLVRLQEELDTVHAELASAQVGAARAARLEEELEGARRVPGQPGQLARLQEKLAASEADAQRALDRSLCLQDELSALQKELASMKVEMSARKLPAPTSSDELYPALGAIGVLAERSEVQEDLVSLKNALSAALWRAERLKDERDASQKEVCEAREARRRAEEVAEEEAVRNGQLKEALESACKDSAADMMRLQNALDAVMSELADARHTALECKRIQRALDDAHAELADTRGAALECKRLQEELRQARADVVDARAAVSECKSLQEQLMDEQQVLRDASAEAARLQTASTSSESSPSKEVEHECSSRKMAKPKAFSAKGEQAEKASRLQQQLCGGAQHHSLRLAQAQEALKQARQELHDAQHVGNRAEGGQPYSGLECHGNVYDTNSSLSESYREAADVADLKRHLLSVQQELLAAKDAATRLQEELCTVRSEAKSSASEKRCAELEAEVLRLQAREGTQNFADLSDSSSVPARVLGLGDALHEVSCKSCRSASPMQSGSGCGAAGVDRPLLAHIADLKADGCTPAVLCGSAGQGPAHSQLEDTKEHLSLTRSSVATLEAGLVAAGGADARAAAAGSPGHATPDQEQPSSLELDAMRKQVGTLERQEDGARAASGSPFGVQSVAGSDAGALLAVLEEDALAFERHVLRHEHFSAAVRARLRSVARSVQRRLQAAAAKVREARAAAAAAAAATAAAEARADALSVQLAAAGVQLDADAAATATNSAAANSTQLRILSDELAAAQAEVLSLTQQLAKREVELQQARRATVAPVAQCLPTHARGRLSPERAAVMLRDLAQAVAAPAMSPPHPSATPACLTPLQALRSAEATDKVITRSSDVRSFRTPSSSPPFHLAEPRHKSLPPPHSADSSAGARSATPECSSSPSALLSHIFSSLDSQPRISSCPPLPQNNCTTDSYSSPSHSPSVPVTSKGCCNSTLALPPLDRERGNFSSVIHPTGDIIRPSSDDDHEPHSTESKRRTIAIPAAPAGRSHSLLHNLAASPADAPGALLDSCIPCTLNQGSLGPAAAIHSLSRALHTRASATTSADLPFQRPNPSDGTARASKKYLVLGTDTARIATNGTEKLSLEDLVDQGDAVTMPPKCYLSPSLHISASDTPNVQMFSANTAAPVNVAVATVPGGSQSSNFFSDQQRALRSSEPGAGLTMELPAGERATAPAGLKISSKHSNIMSFNSVLQEVAVMAHAQGLQVPQVGAKCNEVTGDLSIPTPDNATHTVAGNAAKKGPERNSPTAAVRSLLEKAESLEDERLHEGLALAHTLLRQQAQTLAGPLGHALDTHEPPKGLSWRQPSSAAFPDLGRGLGAPSREEGCSPDALHAFTAGGRVEPSPVAPDIHTPSRTSSPAAPEASLAHAVTSAATPTSELARRLAAMRGGY
jgi:hypothetical protein